MKKFFCILIILSAIHGCGLFDFNSQPLDLINADLAKKYVLYLASDELNGRNTPSAGLDSAAAFIAKEFQSYGLAPVNGSYFQKVNLGKVNLGKENVLEITRSGVKKTFEIKSDFSPFEMTADRGVDSSLVFAGYGITAENLSYDDYRDVDVKDKIVVVLRHEPGELDDSSVFNGKNATEYSDVNYKVKNAIRHGASALMIITDPLNHTSLTPRGYPWPSLSKTIPKDALPLVLILDESRKIPVIHIGESVAEFLFGSIDSLKKIQKRIDENLTSHSFIIPDSKAFVKTSTQIEHVLVNNVVGLVEGSDPVLKSETVVVGAHYDHVGIKKNSEPGTDSIFNGADDNASGTAGLMLVANAFGSMVQKPARSMLFIAFAGEEKGLLGSEAYVEYPLFPLDKTVAMLNLDMIGRNSPDSLYIIAWSRSPDLNKINTEENKKVGFNLRYDLERLLAQSDHASFLKRKVPVLFFNSGENEYYHKVIDNPESIDFHKVSRAAKLVFFNTLRIANDSVYYKIIDKPISFF